MLVEWNATRGGVSRRRSACISSLRRRWSGRPRRWRSSARGSRLSYQELNRQANQLAHHLREQGVGPGDAWWRCWPSGASPSWSPSWPSSRPGEPICPSISTIPLARLCRVLEQSGCRLVLTTAAFAADAAQHALREACRRERSSPLHQLRGRACRPAAGAEENLPLAQRAREPGLCHLHLGLYGTAQRRDGRAGGGCSITSMPRSRRWTLRRHDTRGPEGSAMLRHLVWQFLAALVVGGRARVYPDEWRTILACSNRSSRTGSPSWKRCHRCCAPCWPNRRNGGRASAALAALRWLIPTGEALPADLCRHWLKRYPARAPAERLWPDRVLR